MLWGSTVRPRCCACLTLGFLALTGRSANRVVCITLLLQCHAVSVPHTHPVGIIPQCTRVLYVTLYEAPCKMLCRGKHNPVPVRSGANKTKQFAERVQSCFFLGNFECSSETWLHSYGQDQKMVPCSIYIRHRRIVFRPSFLKLPVEIPGLYKQYFAS